MRPPGAGMGGLVALELFKLRKRWMPYILLIVLMAFVLLSLWGAYGSYRSLPPEPAPPPGLTEEQEKLFREGLREGRIVPRERIRRALTLPNSMAGVFSTTQGIGTILLAILTASALGAEYRWGTVRQLLARGVSRRGYLGAKLAALGLTALIGVVAVFLIGFVATLVVARLVEGSWQWGFLSPDLLVKVLLSLGRTWYAMAVYLLLAALFTVLLRSTAGGMALALVYNFLEAITIALVTHAFPSLAGVRLYTLGYNIQGLMALNKFEETGLEIGVHFSPVTTGLPSGLQAAGVLAAYGVAFAALAFYLFRRRDLTL